MRRALAFVLLSTLGCADDGIVTVDGSVRYVDSGTRRDAGRDAGNDRGAALDRGPVGDAGTTDRGAPIDTNDPRCAAGVDSDGDGLSDADECRLGTDPRNPDSDGDRLSDGQEANYPRACVAMATAAQRRPPPRCARDEDCTAGERCRGLDPQNPDSDGDRVADGIEDPDGNGQIDPMRGETDPRLSDTAGDGRGDANSGLAICRPTGLATVVQVVLPGAPTQVGHDPRFARSARVTGTAGRGAIVVDEAATGVAGVVAAIPSMGDARAEAARVEALVTAALAAGTTPVLVGRALRSHEGHDGVASTYRVARATTASALRDAVVLPLVGAAAPAGAAVGGGAEFLVDVTTVRRATGRSSGTTDVIVAVAPRAQVDDRALLTGIRQADLVSATAVAESDRGLGFACQSFRAPAAARVDFVWTVDVSISMNPYQQAIGDTATRFFQVLRSAGVDFRVAVLRAQSTAFNFAAPGLRFVAGSAANGAQELAWRVTVSPYMMQAVDRLQPYPHVGDFAIQLHEEPLAAGVLAIEALAAGAARGAPEDQRVRDGARVVAFFVADETGRNDDMRYFELDRTRWGATYLDRLRRAVEFYRSRNVLTFGMVNDQQTDCAAGDARDMRRCLILGNGGAYVPIVGSTPADVAAAMSRIVEAVIGATSPYRLDRTPITSTLRVRVRGRDVPRSRAEGFDYDGASNSVVFFGATHRPALGDDVVISYRVWQPCPGAGGRCAGDSECCAPQTCRLGRCTPPCVETGATCSASAECCPTAIRCLRSISVRFATVPVSGRRAGARTRSGSSATVLRRRARRPRP